MRARARTRTHTYTHTGRERKLTLISAVWFRYKSTTSCPFVNPACPHAGLCFRVGVITPPPTPPPPPPSSPPHSSPPPSSLFYTTDAGVIPRIVAGEGRARPCSQ